MKVTEANADKVFSQYIRLHYCEDNGYCKCVTCGNIKFWKKIDCGHYVKREFHRLRYNRYNCHPQCRKCNRFNSGMQDEYARYIIEKYGIKVFDDLMIKKKITFTGSLYLLQASVIEECVPEIKRLKKEKNL